MKFVIGIVILLAGVSLAAFIGLYGMFFLGFTDFIDAVKETPVNPSFVGFSLFKVMFGPFIFSLLCKGFIEAGTSIAKS